MDNKPTIEDVPEAEMSDEDEDLPLLDTIESIEDIPQEILNMTEEEYSDFNSKQLALLVSETKTDDKLMMKHIEKQSIALRLDNGSFILAPNDIMRRVTTWYREALSAQVYVFYDSNKKVFMNEVPENVKKIIAENDKKDAEKMAQEIKETVEAKQYPGLQTEPQASTSDAAAMDTEETAEEVSARVERAKLLVRYSQHRMVDAHCNKIQYDMIIEIINNPSTFAYRRKFGPWKLADILKSISLYEILGFDLGKELLYLELAFRIIESTNVDKLGWPPNITEWARKNRTRRTYDPDDIYFMDKPKFEMVYK